MLPCLSLLGVSVGAMSMTIEQVKEKIETLEQLVDQMLADIMAVSAIVRQEIFTAVSDIMASIVQLQSELEDLAADEDDEDDDEDDEDDTQAQDDIAIIMGTLEELGSHCPRTESESESEEVKVEEVEAPETQDAPLVDVAFLDEDVKVEEVEAQVQEPEVHEPSTSTGNVYLAPLQVGKRSKASIRRTRRKTNVGQKNPEALKDFKRRRKKRKQKNKDLKQQIKKLKSVLAHAVEKFKWSSPGSTSKPSSSTELPPWGKRRRH